MVKDVEATRGPTAYHDLGFENADEMALKSALANRLHEHIKANGLSITDAAKRLGIGQPDLSNLLRGRFDKYSVMSLMRFLTIFGENVNILLTPARAKRGAITVSPAA